VSGLHGLAQIITIIKIIKIIKIINISRFFAETGNRELPTVPH